MIKFENTEVWGFEHAFRGVRNPMNSWNRSDSKLNREEVLIGENDMNLAQRLIKGGSEHRKFLRQIFVSVDITAPLYFFKEFDTYKVGTTANSTSTMHKIHAKEFTLEDFSHEYLFNNKSLNIKISNDFEFDTSSKQVLNLIIQTLNMFRTQYIEEEEKDIKKMYWWQMIQLLPSSYNQTRTITMTYENLLNMYRQRKNHKLDEWRVGFVEWVESLPYAKELIMYTGEE